MAWADFIGIPFAERGRTREGVDCWGLVRLVLHHKFRIEVPSYADRYEHTKQADKIAAHVKDTSASWISVLPGAEEVGDVIVMRVGGRAMHVGVVVDKGKMLHVERGINSCIERYDGVLWRNRIVGFYRHAELA